MDRRLIKSFVILHSFMLVQLLVIASASALPLQNACSPYESAEVRMNKYFKMLKSNAQKLGAETNGVIAGIEFKNEIPLLLWAFRELVAVPVDWRREKEDKISPLQNRYKVNPKCVKVLCAADKIFGNGVGQRMVYLQARYDLNSSKIVFKNSSNFTVAELNSIIQGVSQYPERLLPIQRSQQMTKFLRGYTLGEYNVEGLAFLADASMTFFDSWSTWGPNFRSEVVVHELAHNMSNRSFPAEISYSIPKQIYQRLDESSEWLKLSGWKGRDSTQHALNYKKFVSDYASENATEDFAEAITHYILNPKGLLTRHKEKYDFIKTYVFGGQEFIIGKCDHPTFLSILQKNYSKTYALNNLNDVSDLSEKCVGKHHFKVKPNMVMSCVDYHIIRKLLKSEFKLTSELMPVELISPMTEGFSVHFPLVYAQVIEFISSNEGYAPYEEKMAEIKKQGLLEYTKKKALTSAEGVKNFWEHALEVIYQIYDLD